MSVKGKIYGKYLKRAKYVVKGKKLKSPIATIQKREIMAQSKNQLKEINEFLKEETEFLKKLVDQKQEQKQLEKSLTRNKMKKALFTQEIIVLQKQFGMTLNILTKMTIIVYL